MDLNIGDLVGYYEDDGTLAFVIAVINEPQYPTCFSGIVIHSNPNDDTPVGYNTDYWDFSDPHFRKIEDFTLFDMFSRM